MAESSVALAVPPQIPWQRDPETGEELVSVPEVCGPLAWSMLHKWAEAVHDDMCPSCGEFAIGAASALHDVVNIKLGKPVRNPEVLVNVLGVMNHMASQVGIAPAIAAVAQSPIAELAATRAQYEAITQSIIAAMERGIVPWRKPWTTKGFSPYNAISGRPYRGLNVPILVLGGYGDPRWMTFNQAKKKGAHVRKGERGQLVYFWKIDRKDTGEVDDKGETIYTRIFIFRMYNVFNVEQIDGLGLKPIQAVDHEPIPEAERIAARYVARSDLIIDHTADPRAYYSKLLDQLHMPLLSMFKDPKGYYCTLFHEMGHSTGHDSRLNRRSLIESAVFGDPEYSEEELVAEFTSAFVCSEAGLPNVEPSAAYIEGWLSALKNDPGMLVFAAGQGQKAADYILGSLEEDQPEVAEAVPVAQPLALGQGRDPWGSRCRDELGRWSLNEFCGPPPAGATVTNNTFAVGANGVTRYEFEFRVVDVGELVVSHDPFTFEPNADYPQELQPRLRERAATRLQVQKIAQTLDPDSLLTDFHVLDRGAPIVGEDLVVESGNGRIMALAVAAADIPDRYAVYRDQLFDRLPGYGLKGMSFDLVPTPVLVRVRLTEVDRPAFTQEANTPVTIASSAIEQARVDATKISLEMLQLLTVGETQGIEDALRSRNNAAFVGAFLKKLPDQEQARLVDAQGLLNQDGVRRTLLAVFVSAFQGDAGLRLAEMSFESIDLDVRNVVSGIARALGELAQAEALTRAGTRAPDLTIADDLAAGANVFARIKRTPGLSVADYLGQKQLFDRELDPFQEGIVVALDERSRSAKRIGLVLRTYAQLVIASPPPQQTSFLPEPGPDKGALWNRALQEAEIEAVAAQTDPRKHVDWCNMTGVEIDTAWSWRPLRDVVVTAQGMGASVWLCTIGLVNGQLQLTIDTRSLAPVDERRLQLDIERGLGRSAKQVIEFGVRRLIYEITLPGAEPSDLVFEPQEVIAGPTKPAGFQPSLLQMRQGLGGSLLNGLALGVGVGVGSLAIDRALKATAAAAVANQDSPHLDHGATALDLSGKGEFISEQIKDPGYFDPESIRTITTGDHRRRVGCPEGQFSHVRGRCTTKMQTQSVLHPRTERDQLVAEAMERGIQVATDMDEYQIEVRGMVRKVLAGTGGGDE